KNDGLLGIYPEGTRSPDGNLYRGKVGVAKLVLTTGVPVVPVAMIGTDKVQPIGRRIPNIRRIGLIFGEPLDFSRYKGMEDDRFVQRSVTDEIMYELMRLSGQEYVDTYASTVKERLAARKSAKPAAGREGSGRGAAVRLEPSADGSPKPGTVTVIGAGPQVPAAGPQVSVPGPQLSAPATADAEAGAAGADTRGPAAPGAAASSGGRDPGASASDGGPPSPGPTATPGPAA
ncbi:MAG: 1-acyl-sn-glycerol-3-phosphate acyltransferase, partial [Actinomycetales bacterium]